MSSSRIALVIAVLLVGCDKSDETLAPSLVVVKPHMTPEYCEQTPGCTNDPPPPPESEPGPAPVPKVTYNSIHDFKTATAVDYYAGDPNPSADGIWIGAWASDCYATYYPASTASSHYDFDSDGLDDGCEFKLAHAFRPMIRLAVGERCPLGEPYWAAKFFDNTPYNTGDFVRIAYLPAFYDDCGELGHKGDSEFIQLTVAFNGATKHWVLINSWISAHAVIGRPAGNSIFGPLGSNSSTYGPNFEWPAGRKATYPRIWVSSDKHAFYRTKSACDAGGAAYGAFENCNQGVGDHDDGRFYVFSNRNIGSAHKILKDCVKSTNIVGGNIECLWTGTKFTGWQVQPTTSAPPYLPFLNSTVYGCYMLTTGLCWASRWGM